MPAGLEETVPVPTFVSVSAFGVSNLAVTVLSALGVTVHGPVPEQAPDQPAKLEPAAGVAVSVTGTAAKGAEQVEPQLIAFGLEVTVPEPLPVLVTVRVLPL